MDVFVIALITAGVCLAIVAGYVWVSARREHAGLDALRGMVEDNGAAEQERGERP